MPAVNQSPLEHLHIDPVVGYVGLAFSLFINLGAILYPKSLVSGIGLQCNEGEPPQVWVANHSLPGMRPSKTGRLYDVGEVAMDPASQETKRILDTMDGNLREFQGYLALKAARRRLPYLVQIQDPNEVIDPFMLLDILVNPEDAVKQLKRRDMNPNTGSTSEPNKKVMSGKLPKKTARGRKGRRR